jgi:hypothetical protein
LFIAPFLTDVQDGAVTVEDFNSERSYLRFEECKPVLDKRDMGVHMIDLYREIFKPVLRLEFTAHGIYGVLSDFRRRALTA